MTSIVIIYFIDCSCLSFHCVFCRERARNLQGVPSPVDHSATNKSTRPVVNWSFFHQGKDGDEGIDDIICHRVQCYVFLKLLNQTIIGFKYLHSAAPDRLINSVLTRRAPRPNRVGGQTLEPTVVRVIHNPENSEYSIRGKSSTLVLIEDFRTCNGSCCQSGPPWSPPSSSLSAATRFVRLVKHPTIQESTFEDELN